MNAVIYVRVSTEEQAKGHSLAAQEARCRDGCAQRELEVAAVYVEALSTRRARRPECVNALADARKGAVLVSTAMDRVGRTMTENVALIAEARDGKITWVTLDGELDTRTASGRFAAHVKAAQAEYERDRLSERTREGLAQAKREGVRLGRERVIAPDVEAHIRELSASMSLAKVAQRLHEAGIYSPGGRPWARSTLHRVVCRPAVP